MFLAESSSIDFSSIMSAFTTAVTPAMVISLVAVGLGGALGIWFAWVGVRKLIDIVQNALQGRRVQA